MLCYTGQLLPSIICLPYRYTLPYIFYFFIITMVYIYLTGIPYLIYSILSHPSVYGSTYTHTSITTIQLSLLLFQKLIYTRDHLLEKTESSLSMHLYEVLSHLIENLSVVVHLIIVQ